MSPETRTRILHPTPKHTLTLSQLTRGQLVKAINQVDPPAKYANLRPAPVEGYPHEDALEHVGGYKEQWHKYLMAVNNANVFICFGAAWQAAWLDMDGNDWKVERDAALEMGRKLNLPSPNIEDLLDLGGLVYALIDKRVPEELDSIATWLWEGAELIDTEAVAEERKSPESNGEQPPAPGNNPGDAPKNQGRRKNARNRGG